MLPPAPLPPSTPPPNEPPPSPEEDLPPAELPPPDLPPSEPPPPAEPQPQQPDPPAPNQCFVRCCDENLQGPSDTLDSTSCHNASQDMCANNLHVMRSEWNGQLVWERPQSCWAKCWNREAYHLGDVPQNCAVHAKSYYSEGDRGGLQDATWSRRQP